MRRIADIVVIRAAFRYDPESGHLTWVGVNQRMLGRRAGCFSGRYRKICIGGVRIFEHRVIWALVYGSWPEGEIDHVDRDGHNNRLQNLREVSRSENCLNRGVFKTNSLGVPCIKQLSSGTYQARIQKDGKRVTLGTFKLLSEAKYAVAEAKRAQ
jgi:hypothetical protein